MKDEMVENRISENRFGVVVKPRESGCCGGEGQGRQYDLASLAGHVYPRIRRERPRYVFGFLMVLMQM